MVKKNILLVSPPFVAVPPKGYGGTERIVYDLIKDASSNINYTLLAPATSNVGCTLKTIADIPLFDDSTYNHATDRKDRSLLANKQIIKHAKNIDFDLIHSVDYENADLLYDLMQFNKPILVSVHHAILPRIEKIISEFKDFPLVDFHMLSKNHAESYSHLGNFPFIYNGLSSDRFEFSNIKHPFIFSMGDTKPIKGHIVASKIARATGYDLILAGAPAYPEAQEYFDNNIIQIIDFDLSNDKSRRNDFIDSINNDTYVPLGGKVIYIGSVDDIEKKPLLSKASFVNMMGELEFPSKHFEACPTVGLESLLSKTKVLTTPSNPVSEFIRGDSGYVINSPQEAIEVINNSSVNMNESDYIAILNDFSSKTMSANYAKLYSLILDK